MNRLERMKSYLPEHFAESPEIIAILEDGDRRFDELNRTMDDVLNQFFVETATWGLDKWEDELEILPITTEFETRRNRIINKLTSQTPTNYKAIENEVNRFLRNPSSNVRHQKKSYRFEVNIPFVDLQDSVTKIIDVVEEMKPAHLNFYMVHKVNIPLILKAAMLTGEEITVYPWSSKSIELKGAISLGSYTQSFETFTVYPQ